MSLLRDIQDAAISSKAPIGDLLRRCKVLAARLGSSEFGEWVEYELNGYPDDAELPDYRVSEVHSLGHFSGPFGSGLRNAAIPPSNIPEKFRDRINWMRNRQPISALEDLLTKKGEGSFQAPWPPDLVKFISQDVYENMSCMSAWQVIPRGVIVAAVDAVRNRILSFAIDVEKVAPAAGEAAAGAAPLPPERVHQIFQTNIYGGTVGNVATGGERFSQNTENLISQGDWSALSAQLGALGLSQEDGAALKGALAEDEKEKKPGIGRAVAGWIGKALVKAADGVLNVGVDVASKVLPTLISSYLGLPPSK